MTIGSHVPRITPLNAMHNIPFHHLSYPANVAKKGTLCRLLELLTGQRFENRFGIDGKEYLDA